MMPYKYIIYLSMLFPSLKNYIHQTMGFSVRYLISTISDYSDMFINPYDVGSRYTDFVQTSLRRQKSVYRRHGR